MGLEGTILSRMESTFLSWLVLVTPSPPFTPSIGPEEAGGRFGQRPSTRSLTFPSLPLTTRQKGFPSRKRA